MKSEGSSAPFRPRLVRLSSGRGIAHKLGCLQLDDAHEPVCIGPLDSVQYKLVQSLFNPTNKLNGRYHAVLQTTERTFRNVLGKEPFTTTYVSTRMKQEVNAVVAEIIRAVQETEAGKYLRFIQTEHHITMEITPPAT